jgi:hypothetical protein
MATERWSPRRRLVGGTRSPGAAGGWTAAWPRRAAPAAPPPARSAGPPSKCGTSSPAPASPCPPSSLRAALSPSLSPLVPGTNNGGEVVVVRAAAFLSLARWVGRGLSLSKKARAGRWGVGWGGECWSVESNGRKVRGRCVVAHGPHPFF